MAKSSRKESIPVLDLHGRRVEEVFDLMDRFLRAQEEKGSRCVRILHGVGTGKVKEKVLEYCKLTNHTPKMDKAETGKANPGSFLLFLYGKMQIFFRI